MLFWIICIGLALGVAALVAVPLLRREADAEGPDRKEVEIYRAQLSEIDRDIARGVITGEEAERTRTEVARRLLAADAAAPRALGRAPRGATLAVGLIAALLVSGGGLALYAWLGAADASGPYPDIPRATRIAAAEERAADRPSQAEAMASTAMLTPPGGADPDHEALVQRLREAVAQTPDDPEGLAFLARAEAGLGNFEAALAAQDRLIALMPEGSPRRRAEVTRKLDLMVSAVQGYVSPEAEAIARALIEENPRSLPGRYYLALHFRQVDRPDQAFALWRAVIADGPPESPHVQLAREFVQEAAFRAGVEYQVPPLPGAGAVRGPSSEDMAAAEDMDAEAQQQMIRGMVSQLSDRLANEGGTSAEWAQLIGALGVLGETERAEAILGEARQVFAGQTADLAQIEAAANRAGLE